MMRGGQGSQEIFHDGSLEVTYSEEAARVLKLIEDLKMQLNSREVLLEKLRNYRETYDEVPAIKELESKLNDVGCDQIATHFSSYFGYLTAAFDNDVDTDLVVMELKTYVTDYLQKYHMQPSLKAILLNFREKQLYMYTENEIKILLLDLENSTLPSINEVSDLSVNISAPNVEPTNSCAIIEKYKGKISTRSELKALPEHEQNEIKSRYRSASVFLKKLKEA